MQWLLVMATEAVAGDEGSLPDWVGELTLMTVIPIAISLGAIAFTGFRFGFDVKATKRASLRVTHERSQVLSRTGKPQNRDRVNVTNDGPSVATDVVMEVLDDGGFARIVDRTERPHLAPGETLAIPVTVVRAQVRGGDQGSRTASRGSTALVRRRR